MPSIPGRQRKRVPFGVPKNRDSKLVANPENPPTVNKTIPKTEAEISETEVEQADRDLEAGKMYASQETDLDTNKYSAYDSAKKETKQEVNPNGQQGKAEDHESFIRRMREGSRRVKQIGKTVFAYEPARAIDTSGTVSDAARELRRLGIKYFYHNGLEYNQDGYTYQGKGDASTLADGSVAVFGKSFGDGIELAGHEAFHTFSVQHR